MASVTTDADSVARELARNRKPRYVGSVWKLGRVLLTTIDGKLTGAGRVFRAQNPSVSLSHFDHRSERIAGRQARARDAIGRERIVARMVDGKMAVTKLGQSYYAPGPQVFTAFVPAWRHGVNGDLKRSSVAIDDAWNPPDAQRPARPR